MTQTATPLPTPLPTATPISKESALQSYQDYLRAYGLSDQDYRKYTEMRLLSDKVRQAIGDHGADNDRADQVPVHAHRCGSSADRHGGDRSRMALRRCITAILSNTLPYSTSVLASEVTTGCRMTRSLTPPIWGPPIGDAFFSTPVSQTTAIISNTTDTASLRRPDHGEGYRAAVSSTFSAASPEKRR